MYLNNCIYAPILKKDYVQQCETFYNDSIHLEEITPPKKMKEFLNDSEFKQ